jgi:tRNA(adenine34) deaminase
LKPQDRRFIKINRSNFKTIKVKNPTRKCNVWGTHAEEEKKGKRMVNDLSSEMIEGGMKAADAAMMREALAEARAAAERGEVPVGAVVVHEGRVVARGGNRTIADCDPTAHAEMVVLREAARVIGNYRLAGATVYVTVEPCAMCAGALIQARVARLVYGCAEPKGGAVRSSLGVLENPAANHRVEIVHGVMAEECAGTLREFFEARR